MGIPILDSSTIKESVSCWNGMYIGENEIQKDNHQRITVIWT